MVESMRIDNQVNHYQTNINNNITINLNDSLKLVKTEQTKFQLNCGSNNDPMLPPRRAHSNSFGSADSGYDSPAAVCFPQEFNGSQNLLANRNAVNNGVPNKPPPPYQGGFPPAAMRHQQGHPPGMFGHQPPTDMGPGNFFPNGPMGPAGPVRSTIHNQPSAPRLKHLPLSTYAPQPQSTPQFNQPQQQQQMGRSFSMQVQNTTAVYNGGPFGNGEMKIKQEFESKTINTSTNNNTNNNNNNNNNNGGGWENMMGDIPSDLHAVKLFDFQDQQQLASDLDAIIKNDLNSATSLQAICEPYPMSTGGAGLKPYSRDMNNNVKIPQYMNSMMPTHDWVR